jgi:phage terminase small subunit
MPLKSGKFTEQEQRFIEAFAATGDVQAAAHRARYKSSSGVMKAHDPRILAAVEARRREFVLKDALPLAMATHLELLQAPTPAAVRRQADQGA